MIKEERQKEILKYLEKNEIAKTKALSDLLDVSLSTIRRDFKEISDNENIERVHGGLSLITEEIEESDEITKNIPYQIRKNKNINEKIKIAEEAVKYIEEGDVIYLDAGTTTLQISNLIKKKKFQDLSVITNSIEIAYDLSFADINLKVLGGDLRNKIFALVGRETEKAIDNIWVNKLFLAASGINLEHGITSTDVFQAHLKSKLINIAEEIILVVDSSKINKNALNSAAKVDVIDKIITDNDANPEFIKELEKMNIDVIIVDK
jgi:DeoR family fructose operon transcriptional repressor